MKNATWLFRTSTAALTLISLQTAFIPLSAATYYLSFSSGDNANDGISPQKPWKTLDRIYLKSYSSAPFQPGDHVLLNRGEAWDGQIRLYAAGTSAKPVILGAYGTGPNPIVYGDNHTAQWIAVSGHPGIFQTSLGQGSIVYGAYEGTTPLSPVRAPGGCCDLNADGKVDITDVQLGINAVVAGTPCGVADANSDHG